VLLGPAVLVPGALDVPAPLWDDALVPVVPDDAPLELLAPPLDPPLLPPWAKANPPESARMVTVVQRRFMVSSIVSDIVWDNELNGNSVPERRENVQSKP
jgi:hypothetical protein